MLLVSLYPTVLVGQVTFTPFKVVLLPFSHRVEDGLSASLSTGSELASY